MLEKSDLMAIENLLDKKLDERFAEQDKSMDKKLEKMKKDLEKMDLFLLDEIERNRNILETRMDRMQQDMDEVKSEIRQLYRITGVENERMDMELAELDKRLTKLEERTMA